MSRRPVAQAIGWALILIFWTAVAVVMAAAGTEFWLRLKSGAATAGSAYDRLCALYKPFTIQHLHPNYLFFFPLDAKERTALGNPVCRLTPDGFRGWGPDERGNRRLAFILGGSSAFGAQASSDQATLAGCLNRIQDEYFFVNAGVPSWQSTQSLSRLVNQIMPLKPDLVVSFEMANDAAILLMHHRNGLSYPPGTPENFNALVSLVDDLRSGRPKAAAPSLMQRLLPNLSQLAEKKLFRKKRKKGLETPVPDDLIDLHASKYVTNLGIMGDLLRSRGARLLAVIQPISLLHKTSGANAADKDVSATCDFYARFHHSVLRQAPRDLPLLDLAAFFDRHFDRLPIRRDDEELSPDLVLADRVHLTDRGNEMVAREIWSALQARGLTTRPRTSAAIAAP